MLTKILAHFKDPFTWLYGLVSGVIGGAASSVSSYFGLVLAHNSGANVTVPNWETMGILFVSGGIAAGVAYLMKSPLPALRSDGSEITFPGKVGLIIGFAFISMTLVGCDALPVKPADSVAGGTVSTDLMPASWTQFGLEAAGAGTATSIIVLVDQNNPEGTAGDILNVCSAALTIVVTKDLPSVEQIETIMIGFKSNSTTTNYSKVAHQFALKYRSQVQQLLNSGVDATTAQQYAAWFILGAQTGAQGYLIVAPIVNR